MTYDYIIIGGGVIGAFIAREMSKYELSVLVVEKENDLATIQSLHNSAVIHAGNDPYPNTLKAKFNVLGNKLYDEVQKELDIPIKKIGAYTVAHNKDELQELNELLERAQINGVENAEIISGDFAREIEPNLSNEVIACLYTPSTKVIDPVNTTKIVFENAHANGINLSLNTEVLNIYAEDNLYYLETNKGVLKTKGVINSAGIFADDVAKLIEPDFKYHSINKRGEYLAFSTKANSFINKVIYPLPSKEGKGVLVIPKIDNSLLIGPTNTLINGKEDYGVSDNIVEYITEHALLMVKHVPLNELFAKYSGIRSGVNYPDFYIKESAKFNNFFNLLGMESPALSGAPAIARYITRLIGDKMELKPNLNFNPKLRRSYL